ncbi:MAG TPA: hypothetical protein VJ932_02725, partial [Alkalispirochaeta sp.]|nr:hypothetical protein [Alkalispirochaeta sp.]
MLRTRVIGLAIVSLLAFSVGSVAAGGQEEVSEDATKTLRVAVPTFPNSLDASIASERNAQNVAWQMFDSLVWANDDNVIEPALAQDWDVS